MSCLAPIYRKKIRSLYKKFTCRCYSTFLGWLIRNVEETRLRSVHLERGLTQPETKHWNLPWNLEWGCGAPKTFGFSHTLFNHLFLNACTEKGRCMRTIWTAHFPAIFSSINPFICLVILYLINLKPFLNYIPPCSLLEQTNHCYVAYCEYPLQTLWHSVSSTLTADLFSICTDVSGAKERCLKWQTENNSSLLLSWEPKIFYFSYWAAAKIRYIFRWKTFDSKAKCHTTFLAIYIHWSESCHCIMSWNTNHLYESFCHSLEFALLQNIINAFEYKLVGNKS